MKTKMKLVTAVITVLTILPFTAVQAHAKDISLPDTIQDVIPPFKGEGPFVEGVARTGGVIVGGTSAIVLGIPMGLAGLVIGAPLGHPETAELGFMAPTVAGGALGQITLGSVVYIPKKICYDAPRKILRHLNTH